MAAPPGWIPPYQGPPPMPAYMNVNQRQWNAGYWQFNSAYRHHHHHATYPPFQVPWQPGLAWPQMSEWFKAPLPIQRGKADPYRNANPWKKISKPPSAEYMASKLSDNPLGLHDLVPVENRYGDEGEPGAPTPWIWNPGKLADEDALPSKATAKESRNHTSRPSESSRARQASEPAMSSQQRSVADNKNVRHGTDPTPVSGKTSVDHKSSAISSASASSFSARDVLPKLDRPLDRPKDPGFYTRRGMSPPKNLEAPRHADVSLSQRTSPPVPDQPHHQPPSSASLVPKLDRPLDRPKDPEFYRRRGMSPPRNIDASRSQPTSPPVPDRSHRPPPSSAPPAPKLDRPLDRLKDQEFYRRRGMSPPRSIDDSRLQRTTPPVPEPPPSSAPPISESFTAKQELVPTFSSGIIITPDYYRNSSRSSSSPSTCENSKGSIDSATSRMQRLSTSSSSSSSRTEALTRHSSMPSTISFNTPESSISGSTLVEEPSSMLSPLMIAHTPKPGARSVVRHSTYPGVSSSSAAHSLATICESPANATDLTPIPAQRVGLQQHTPPESIRRSSSRDESIAHGRTSGNIYAPVKVTPPRDATQHVLQASPGGSRASSSRHRDAPVTSSSLPSPLTPTHSHEGEPVPRVYLKIGMPAPPISGMPRVPRRKGFWNRRGDHIHGGYVVYAPAELAYPDELKDYPHEDVGYRDEFGSELKYDPDRPELPDSLPLKGKPAVKPYRSLITYDNEPYHHPYPPRSS